MARLFYDRENGVSFALETNAANEVVLVFAYQSDRDHFNRRIVRDVLEGRLDCPREIRHRLTFPPLSEDGIRTIWSTIRESGEDYARRIRAALRAANSPHPEDANTEDANAEDVNPEDVNPEDLRPEDPRTERLAMALAREEYEESVNILVSEQIAEIEQSQQMQGEINANLLAAQREDEAKRLAEAINA